MIDNPIINSPYAEPAQHYRFDDSGITNEIVEGRRESTYFVPVPQIRKRGAQIPLPTFEEKPQENQFVNALRQQVARWRAGGYLNATTTSRRLLEYWTKPDRENRFFFCQIEALETAIYIAEAARHLDSAMDINALLRKENAEYNADLFRIAFKMATGSGKTVVMAMLIAWQVLNKRATPRDPRYTDRFLIVTPGITIKDRLRVLYPNEPDNYYLQRDVVPPELMQQLNSARIVITNFHQFQQRERIDASATTKKILMVGRDESENPFTETPEQMVLRVCDSLRGGGEIIVINDEAHHCYQGSAQKSKDKLDRDESDEVKAREKEARVWFDGLMHVHKKLGIKAVYDLSATPFFLKGSGYGEGTIFPWVVSDFSLIDAIECGIVKIPRVPVTDDTQDADGPINRMLWLNIRESLPKHKTSAAELDKEPELPQELEQALWSLYTDYERRYRQWESTRGTATPPVMIVVCSNTVVSNLLYRYIAGWTRPLPDGNTELVEGRLPLFNNVNGDEWESRPNTILVDSRQLESGDNLSPDFRRAASAEIEAFVNDYRRRYPERSADDISEADLLREVLNSVGRRGRLGEQIRCVVSVSMLSEGWDANNVTHILGVRAFSTQLICEQVVGRGLRRMSYELNEDGHFDPEYAEVYGVPFSFIPSSGKTATDKVGKPTHHVYTLPERDAARIVFPRVIGYRFEAFDGPISAQFDRSSYVTLSAEEFPTRTVMAGIAGAENTHNFVIGDARLQQLQFDLARRVLEEAFVDRDDDGSILEVHHWRFREVLQVVRQWFDGQYLICKDNTDYTMLQMGEKRAETVAAIVEAIKRGGVGAGQQVIYPILAADLPLGATDGIRFDTVRPVYVTGDKCPLNLAVMDTDRWEEVVVQALEAMPEVVRYVKNYRLGFTIPYAYQGVARNYTPDFIAVLENGVNLVIEVSGQDRDDKRAKVEAARSLWIPAVNAHGDFGTWDIIELTDPYMTEMTLRAYLRGDSPTLI